MPVFPPALTLVRVIGQVPITKADRVTPEVGSITFLAPFNLTLSGVCIPQSYTVALQADGTFEIFLPAGDDVDLSYFGWAYHVVERFSESTHEYDSEIWEAHANPELIMFYVDQQQPFTLRRANEVVTAGSGETDINEISNFAINSSQSSRIDAVECTGIAGGACCADHETRIDALEICCADNTACCADHETRIDDLEACCTDNTNCCADHETRIDALEACCIANTACCADHETRLDTLEPIVSSHTTTLATHTTQIAANTACCATNTANIATNTTNIATHTTQIANHETRITALEAAVAALQAKTLTQKFNTVEAPVLNIGVTNVVITWSSAWPSAVYSITFDVQASAINKARITAILLSQTTTTATFQLTVTGLLPIALGSVNIHALGYRLA